MNNNEKKPSYGKGFENQFKKDVLKAGFNIDRFKDQPTQYKKVKNPGDFVAFFPPTLVYVDCKAIRGGTFNFLSHTNQDQISILAEKCEYADIIGGYVVWFIDHDITVFFSAKDVLRFQNIGKKSVSLKADIQSGLIKHIIIPGKKKKIYFSYDIQQFYQRIKHVGSEW